MNRKLALILSILLLASMAPASAQDYTFTGNITTGAQYDLYTIPLAAGDSVIATLVCDFDGVSRPLDPVLSVYYPGSDPSDTINADVYNDDGFGLDDDPHGVDCDAFDSSRVIFFSEVSAEVTFRADGFGSSTGPYTMEIFVAGVPMAIPTVDTVGMTALALLLAGGGILMLRRRRAA